MEDQNNTVLKQADATIEVVGIISEIDLEKVQENENETIRGRIKVKTSDTNTVPIDVYVNKYTKDKKENRTYAGWETRMQTYKSIADVGEKEATVVHIKRGQLRPQLYIDKETLQEMKSVRYSANFMNELKGVDREEAQYKAEFHVTGYIQSMVQEFDKEAEETGRIILNIQVPTYNSIEPLTIFVPEDLADAVSGLWEMGQTADFDGQIVNRAIVTEKVIKRAIGKDLVNKKYDYKNELVLTGGSEPYEEELAYAEAAIRKALADKQISLDQSKNEFEVEKNKSKAAPKASGRTLPRADF